MDDGHARGAARPSVEDMRAIRRHARSVAIVVLLFAVPGVAVAALGLWDASRHRPAGPSPRWQDDVDQQGWVTVDPNQPDVVPFVDGYRLP